MSVPRVNLRTIKRKSGTYYFIDYKVNSKRIRKMVGKNKRDAGLIQAKLQTELTLGTYKALPDEHRAIDLKTLINEFLGHKKNDIRASSLNRYTDYFLKLQDFLYTYFPSACHDIRHINSRYLDECSDWLLSAEIKWSKNTAKSMKEKISSLFKYALDQGYLDENPAIKTKKIIVISTKKFEYFTDEELEQIYESIEPFWLDHIKFMVNTGIRKGEMINLKWVNVDLKSDNKSITIISSEEWQTKTGKSRTIPLNNVALEVLKKWRTKHPEYVFTDKRGLKIHPNLPYKALKKALASTSIKGDIHKLRHTFASKLVMSGSDLYTVKELLGHSDILMTQIYAHLSPGYLQEAVDKLG